LQYTAELLGMTLLDKSEKDDFFMLMRTNDHETFDDKYDKIMSQTIRRKSRRRVFFRLSPCLFPVLSSVFLLSFFCLVSVFLLCFV